MSSTREIKFRAWIPVIGKMIEQKKRINLLREFIEHIDKDIKEHQEILNSITE